MARYRFGSYTLDTATGTLTGPDGVRRLEPQPARVLALLLAARGDLVEREELQREIWGDAHVARDEGLAYCIRRVRAALGDQAAAPRFVETLPRRGYRFLAPVEVGPPGDPSGRDPGGGDRSAREPGAQETGSAGLPTAASRSRMAFALLGFAVLAVAVTVAVRPDRQEPAEPLGPTPLRLAILPLAPAEGPASGFDRELGRALVAALTTRAAERLEVVGPATTGAVDLRGRSQPELGRELAVDYLVSGGTDPAGEIVFLQLIRSADGAHLWAERTPVGAPDAVARYAADAILRRLADR